jgi:arylsulfatase
VDENFDVGADTLTGVDDRDYLPSFAFGGTSDRLTIKIDRPQLSAEDIKKLAASIPGASNKSSE